MFASHITIILLNILISINGEDSDESNKILDGEWAKDGEFPYLMIINTNIKGSMLLDQVCSGVVLHRKWVLTTDRCIRWIQTYGEKLILQLKKVTGDNNYQGGPLYIPEKIHFKDVDYGYEPLALIKVNGTILDADKRIVTLSGRPSKIGTPVVMCGWGIVKEKDIYHSLLLAKRSVKLISMDKCKPKFKNINDYNRYLCGSAANACKGDQGGAVVIKGSSPAQDMLVGLIDKFNTRECTRGINMFANIYHYLGWIKKTMGSDRPKVSG